MNEEWYCLTKQIADELGVSKTAIRKRFTDEFKAQYVETNPDGSLQVTDEGCKLIEESLRKQVQTLQTKFAETGENQSLQAVVETQKETISLLKGQLVAKDEQIRAQQLHAADKKTLMLIENKENERRLSFWERRAAKKAEKKARKEQSDE